MNDYNEILLKLYDILRPFTEGAIELNEETDLVADLGLDSMKVIKLVLKVEDSFDISIPLNILPDVRTVKDFAEHIQRMTLEG